MKKATKKSKKCENNITYRSKSNKNLAKNLRLRRKELGLTQEQLAYMAGTHTNFIGGIEQGRRNPTIESADMIADTLEMPLSLLLSDNYDPDTYKYAIVEKTNNKYSVIDIPENIIKDIIELRKN